VEFKVFGLGALYLDRAAHATLSLLAAWEIR
jgi:hypothetical protein